MRRHVGDRNDDTARLVKRILILLAVGLAIVLAGVSHVGFTYYRQYRHREAFRTAIRAVNAEEAERERFKDDVRTRLLAGDFQPLDSLARELRASRASFPNGVWKLTALYQGLAGPSESEAWSDETWARALARSEEWIREQPDSIAARLVRADLLIGHGWVVRGDGWSNEVPAEAQDIFRKRVDEATAVMKDAERVAEACPHRADRMLGLALVSSLGAEDESSTFAKAVVDFPDYQPIYSVHLRYLQPRWHGEPGQLERAIAAVAQAPGGPEKVARAVWYFYDRNSFDRSAAPWPVVKKGFADMRARHPGSLEVLSASCMFASFYGDRGETARLLEELGGRMATSVWSDQDRFVQAYHWATFEQGEVEGGDPLARFFAWVMGS